MRQVLCHAGVMAVLLSAAAFARADEQADAKALLDQAIKAHGGGDKIEKIKAANVTMKGKFYGMGDGLDYTEAMAFQAPDKLRFEIESDAGGMKFKFTQVFNKDKGWIAVNDNVTEMDKDTIAETKESLYAHAVTQLAPAVFKNAKLAPLGEIKVGDKPALGVRVEVKGHRDVCLFFDKATHLLVKSERRVKEMQGGEVSEEAYYSDFKDVAGVKTPYKITVKHDDKKFVEAEVTDYKPVEKIDDSRFAKP
jgi:zinc protease